MKRIIRSSCKLLLALLLVAGFSQQTYASHYQGGDLTYLCVAPNVYVVTGKVYRDCSGAALSTAETLNWRSPGCNTGGSFSMPLVAGSVQTGLTLGLYCNTPAVQAAAACNSSATLPNFETGTYRTTVTFTTAQQACTEWLFSMRMGNRPTIENIVNGQSAYLYLEAYVKLSNTINNNSPEFAPTSIPVPFVCVNTDVTFSMFASEQDGDSLSYKLVSALDDYNDPETYAVNNNPGSSSGFHPTASPPIINATGQCIVYNMSPAPSCGFVNSPFVGTNLQTAILPAGYCSTGGPGGGSGGYSPTNPLPVAPASIDWTGCKTNVVLGPGGFQLDPQTGTIRFRPNVFHPSAPIAGRNKYVVVVQVDEHRNINGVWTKVGHVRRDILVIVNNCSNTPPGVDVPNPPPITGAIIRQDTVFDVLTCTTTRLLLKHTDTNPGDLLNVTFPDAVAAGNGNFTFPNIPGLVMRPYTNDQNSVNVALYMTPNASTVGQDYFLKSIIKDNACPLPGRVEQLYRIHVNALNRVIPATGAKDRTICLGDSTPINTVLQRPDSIFQNNVLSPGNYTFLWTETNASGGLPNGLRPADQTKRNIVVKPTQTTRYFLSVTSNISGCVDTLSVLVRVDNRDLAMVSGDEEQTICLGGTAAINLMPDTVNGLPVPYSIYQWTVAPGLDSTQANQPNITVRPLKDTRYFVTITNPTAIGCPDTTSVLIRVNSTPGSGPFIGADSIQVCLGGIADLMRTLANPDSINGQVVPYIYTWSNPVHIIPAYDTTQATLSVRPTVTSRWFLTITDKVSRCTDTTSVLVEVNSTPGSAPFIGADSIQVCRGDIATMMRTLANPDSINGQVVPYIYTWTNPKFTILNYDTTQAAVSFIPTETSRWFLTITDKVSRCKDTTSVLVVVDTVNTASLSGITEQAICENTSTPITISVNNPRPGALYTYEWYLAPGVTNEEAGFDSVAAINATSLTVSPQQDTRYFVKVRNSLESCADTASILVRISDMSQQLAIVGGTAKVDYFSSTLLSVFGANPGDTFEWTRVLASGAEDIGTIVGNNKNDTVQVNPLGETEYAVRVTNALGCDTVLYVTVRVGTYFPNVITPNNDGRNDWLEIPNLEPGTLVQIYNRWGALVKEYKSYENSKEKAFSGKDMSDGTYYYYIKEPNGKKTKGWFDIIDNKQ